MELAVSPCWIDGATCLSNLHKCMARLALKTDAKQKDCSLRDKWISVWILIYGGKAVSLM